MQGMVEVKEQIIMRGKVTYEVRPGMRFQSEGDVPSTFRSVARVEFGKRWPAYRVVSVTSTSRTGVQIIFSSQESLPVLPPGTVQPRRGLQPAPARQQLPAGHPQRRPPGR